MKSILVSLLAISLTGCRFVIKEFDSHIGELSSELHK